jgi:PAS domain S-box-containing protein
METWRLALAAEDSERVQSELQEALRVGREFESTFRIRVPDGKLKHIRAAARIERDGDGRPLRMIGVNWDITEQRVAELALRQSEALQRALLAHAGPAIIATHADGKIHLFNRAAEELLGYSAQEIIGAATPVLIHDPAELEARRAALQRELPLAAVDALDAIVLRSRERGPHATEWTYLRKDGTRVPVLLTVTTLRDDAGLITGYLGVAVNLTERKAQERELLELNQLLGERTAQMEVLLQEIHHRVKNNLQVIASLIGMQQRQVSDAAARTALADCKTRIQAIALIHQQLYQSSDYSLIPFSQYAQQLGQRIVAATGIDRNRVSLTFDMDRLALPVEKAIPCGLILNELLTNAFKHAFRDGRSGRVTVSFHLSADADLMLSVADDGVGLGDGFELERCSTLGLHLVRDLATQLDGHAFIGKTSGTLIGVTIPFNREQTQS